MADALTSGGPWRCLTPWPEARADPFRVELNADDVTRAAVAGFLGVEGVRRLSARLTLEPWLDGAEITGEIEAEVTRLCGLTLEPFDVTLTEPLSLRVLPPGSEHAPPPPSAEVDLDLEAEDPPEMLGAEGVDLGDLVVQTLALSLDPFPRKPGAVFAPPETAPEPSPFSVLAALARSKDVG